MSEPQAPEPASAEPVSTPENAGSVHRIVTRAVARAICPAARFAGRVEQPARLPQDDGLLFDTVAPEAGYPDGPVHYLLNGNLNHEMDIVSRLRELKGTMRRGDRVVAVCYATLFHVLAARLGLTVVNKSQTNTLTRHDLEDLACLAGFEVVYLRRARILGFSVAWVVYFRPIIVDPEPPSLSIIVPARNEAGNIHHAFERIPDFPAPTEVLFVEGNSQDDTAEVIERCIADTTPPEHVTYRFLKQPGKGKNDAVIHALENATGEVCVILDADLTVPPEKLPDFYNAYAKGEADFVNGSRLLYPIEGNEMRLVNRFGNVFFAKFLSLVLRIRITDSLCGTKLFRKDDWQRTQAWRKAFNSPDPFGDFDLLFANADMAVGNVNLPIHYRLRTYGDTNISRFRDGFVLFRMVLQGIWWFHFKRF